jgi:hypothetical protein
MGCCVDLGVSLQAMPACINDLGKRVVSEGRVAGEPAGVTRHLSRFDAAWRWGCRRSGREAFPGRRSLRGLLGCPARRAALPGLGGRNATGRM